MEAVKRILLADTGEEFRLSLANHINEEADMQVVGETGDGMELLHMVRELEPDAVVMEMVLTGMDGLEVLEERIRQLGMNPEDYWWYCDLRRYGSCKHAGFGLGFERMVMYLTGVSNIRDVELHPRTVGNAEF